MNKLKQLTTATATATTTLAYSRGLGVLSVHFTYVCVAFYLLTDSPAAFTNTMAFVFHSFRIHRAKMFHPRNAIPQRTLIPSTAALLVFASYILHCLVAKI